MIVRQIRTKQLQAEASIEAEKFNQQLRAQASALETVRDRQSDANDQLDRRNRLQGAIEDAQKELALAQAGADPDTRAAIERDFAGRARQRESLINAGRIGAAHVALHDAKQLGLEAETKLPGARAALTAAEEAAGGNMDDASAALKLHDEEAARLQADLAQAELGAKGPFSMPGLGETAAQKVAKARGAVASHRGRRDELVARQKRIDDATRPARTRVSELEGQALQSRGAVPGLQRNFDQLVAEETNARQIHSQVTPLRAATEQALAQRRETERAAKEALAQEKETNKALERIFRELKTESARHSSQMQKLHNQ